MQYKITARGKCLLSILILSMLVLGGMTTAKEKRTIEVMTIHNKVRSVRVQTLKKEDVLLKTYALGRLSSKAMYNVVAKMPGEVVQTNYLVGDRVKKGETLFILDRKDFENSKNNQLQELYTSKDEVEVQLSYAEKRYKKNKKLYKIGSIAQSELEISKNKYEQLKTRLTHLQAKIKSARDQFDVEADNYYIKAPVDGVVSDKKVEKGMYTQGGEGYIIAQNNPILFTAGIAEKYINKLEVGLTAEVYIHSIDKKVTGTINSISFMKKGNTYPVEVLIDNTDLNIKPGMFAEVYIQYETLKNVIALPPRAIVNSHIEHYIYVLDKKLHEKYTVKKIPIDIIDRVDGKVIVKNNILEHKELIVEGSAFINSKTLVYANSK